MRFPEFADEWKQTTLGEVLDYEQPTNYIVRNTEYSNNVSLIPVLTANKSFILGYTYEQDAYNKGRCIILDDFTLDIKFVNFPFKVKSSAIKILVAKDGTNILFIYNCLLFLRLSEQEKDHKRHYISEIQPLIVALPSLSEQEKIAGFLSLIDERIQSCSETIKERKREKAALLNQLFSQKLRFPQFSDEWQQKTLGEESVIIMGQSPSSSNYNNKGLGLPLIQGNADMRSGRTIIRLYTTEITKEALKDDIIMSVRAPVGALSITPFQCCIGRGVCAIRARKYIYYYLQDCSKTWSKYSAGSTFDSITGENLRNLPLSLPSLAEQQKIADFLSLIDERIEVEEELLEQYERQKRYLLRQMFV
ncbi:restriction endonuclease subunit S [Porphyromonas gingivalis]|uniref:Type I restriction modification DNA specificity domain protein n=1 Tax=Porphyromonas gingivalis F0570 TaxID=1227271 RepID=A0A0E2LPR4_PORGN|nr:restriction endonuclease subunit S [Porphyromonas gingivalis]ERJ65612.1 type I restriction modification DNA specificity domain protein [Porphyromonas gingivalis F0570]ERJ66390.1 type I restriction modification DNA specificity domain protein [Porphyromonas gingivalis F0568]MCE8187392.1 restriction endonuclease subunit S [Porphyromonas gingivalis]